MTQPSSAAPLALAAALLCASAAPADTFLWNNAAGGAFEAAANWKTIVFENVGGNWEIVSEADATRCPDAGDAVYFSGGPATVTLAGDRTVDIIDNLSATYWNKYGNPADQIVFDLQGHTLDIASRGELFTMYGDHSSLVFSNGTVLCTAPLAHANGGDQWRIMDTTGFGIGVTWGENWAAGEPWSDWVPHIRLGLSGTEASLAALWLQGSLATATIDNGASVAVAGDVSVNRGGGDTFVLSGTNTTLSCRTFATSGHSQTNIVENGAVLTAAGIANGWYGHWSDALKQVTFLVRGGGKMILTNDNASLYYVEGVADGGDGAVYYDFLETHNHLVWVDGEGSEIRFDREGGWRNPQFLIGPRKASTNHFLRVSNGALVHGANSSSLVIGGGPGSIDHGVIIEDATVSVGHFLCGSEWPSFETGSPLMGHSSNALIRISGPGALLEARAYGAAGNEANGVAGTITFNYNAHLDIAIPPDGFDQTPIQAPNNRIYSKASEIPGYGTPGCRLTLHARDWSRRHPGSRQVIASSGEDSTGAFQTLIDNASFPDVAGTAYLGELSIEDNGTKLVYACPPAFGTTLFLR
ncbi:MAG: hypothetical protein ACOX5G_11420 [Kiritimatiellia bacterium]|jgi:hypothetical protein